MDAVINIFAFVGVVAIIVFAAITVVIIAFIINGALDNTYEFKKVFFFGLLEEDSIYKYTDRNRHHLIRLLLSIRRKALLLGAMIMTITALLSIINPLL